jgi:hypothetical protein
MVADNIPQELMDMLCAGRLPHAVLIEGRDKEELTAIANYAAYYINCTANNKPCGKCDMCSGVSADLHIWGDEFLPKYPIKEFREALRNVYQTPSKWERNVYVLANFDMMPPQSQVRTQNTLLKLLEEPPDTSQFIILCNDAGVIIPTIMSRVTHIKLGSTEGYSEEVIKQSAQFAIAICNGDKAGIMRSLAPFEKDKTAGIPVYKHTAEILRDILIHNCGIDSRISGIDLDSLNITDIGRDTVIKVIDTLTEMSQYSKRTVSGSLLGAYGLTMIMENGKLYI